MPVPIRIAARRFRGWFRLNPRATLEAQAATMRQIAEAYGLDEIEAERAGSRLQFFRHTVFRDSGTELVAALDDLIARTLAEPLAKEQWTAEVTAIRDRVPLSDRDEFFLARLLYPRLHPAAHATLVREEDQLGIEAPGVIVELHDRQGDPFHVRRPANPTEIAALYRVFRAEGFRPFATREETDHLIVTDAGGRVAGGIVFRVMSPTYVRLEWIVVSRHLRGRGIGASLFTEFLDRLRAQGVRVVSTGFFRPALFRKFGFDTDPRYAGLVRTLTPEEPAG
jgi:GNAT superfamily N-acetyltransferase